MSQPEGIFDKSRELRQCQEQIKALQERLSAEQAINRTNLVKIETLEKAIRLMSNAAVSDRLGRIEDLLERNQGKTMETLDTLAQKVADLRGTAKQEAEEVKGKLDEMTALIEQLQQNASDPTKIAQIGTELDNLRSEIQSVFVGNSPPGGKRK